MIEISNLNDELKYAKANLETLQKDLLNFQLSIRTYPTIQYLLEKVRMIIVRYVSGVHYLHLILFQKIT